MPHRRLAREILENVTPLVRELGSHYWAAAVVRGAPRSLIDLCETAHHLLADLDDWETPARTAGWKPEPGDTLHRVYLDITHRDGEDESYYHAASWAEACHRLALQPAARPILGCWSVTGWLADQLADQDERIGDLAGLHIWARTTNDSFATDETLRAIWRQTTSLPHERDGDHDR